MTYKQKNKSKTIFNLITILILSQIPKNCDKTHVTKSKIENSKKKKIKKNKNKFIYII